MGLRLACGIDRALFASMTGAEPVAALGWARLAPLVAAGYLEVDATHLKATAARRPRPQGAAARPPASQCAPRAADRMRLAAFFLVLLAMAGMAFAQQRPPA